MSRDRFAHLRRDVLNVVTGKLMPTRDVLQLYCVDCSQPIALVTRATGGDLRSTLHFRRKYPNGSVAVVSLYLDTASAPRDAVCERGHRRQIDPEQIRDALAAGEARRAV